MIWSYDTVITSLQIQFAMIKNDFYQRFFTECFKADNRKGLSSRVQKKLFYLNSKVVRGYLMASWQEISHVSQSLRGLGLFGTKALMVKKIE